jgi:hypothetical protein
LQKILNVIECNTTCDQVDDLQRAMCISSYFAATKLFDIVFFRVGSTSPQKRTSAAENASRWRALSMAFYETLAKVGQWKTNARHLVALNLVTK